MFSIRKLLATSFMLAFAVAAFAQPPQAAMGTWKLNVAKSKYSPGPSPKSMTVKFEPAGANGVKLTADGVDGQGQPIKSGYTANYDGKDYPMNGSPAADTVSLRRINDLTTERTDKKNGKVVATLTRVIAKDGKSFTVTTKGVNAKGEPVNNVSVFEKR
jgi:hypothetical protein